MSNFQCRSPITILSPFGSWGRMSPQTTFAESTQADNLALLPSMGLATLVTCNGKRGRGRCGFWSVPQTLREGEGEGEGGERERG